jgi:hypothetical protein
MPRRPAAATPITATPTSAAPEEVRRQRARLSQEDVPGYSLEQAIRVPKAIGDSYAYRPTRPMNVAGAMSMTPSSGPFRGLAGAAIAYGLTTGGPNAPEIGITPLGLRVVRPTTDGDDLAAKREALLRPKVVGEFLRQYDGAPLPTDPIAKNVLLEKGVPAERLEDVLTLILEGAEAVGFLRDFGGRNYVDLAGALGSWGESAADAVSATPVASTAPRLPVQPSAEPAGVTIGPGIHINIEIHIAADATSETVEEIFKNMRRYVLSADGPADEE